ncbi:2Fe-2S iron-sulfur cluster-binding protein [Blastococcus saxobsidens]|uniref:Phthalate 4,5-dioxygenase reductase subunit n=1 Tax=Blastococcus saxobsidens (strain DD2) TaxID=1146883 RepID=H6RX64_BLASD|nr:2Fe-2S iron-sulfur cluster-binding protein [Blastococcus saxobsidens]CCG03472.1 Phthalate 4,5-dioxygenase reductase subunit [Blastococcus saxobsidens DD2]
MTTAAEPAGDVGPLRVECAVAAVGVVVPPGTSILEAVRRAGLEVPAACPDGSCGACETRVLQGEPDHRDGILTADERAFGETMMICVSRARTPRLVLDL